MLMAWPTIVRRFFGDRQFADLLAGDDAPIHRRAPDAGLTSLGWLLVAHSAFSLSFLLPELTFGSASQMHELQELLARGGALGLRSPWWNVGVIVMQSWAGFELIRMSSQSRIIATVFGVIGTAVTLYLSWPLVATMRVDGFRSLGQSLSLGIAMALIIPMATIVLVNRKIAPTARARFRPRPTTPETPPAP
jgi:hypothetical protein